MMIYCNLAYLRFILPASFLFSLSSRSLLAETTFYTNNTSFCSSQLYQQPRQPHCGCKIPDCFHVHMHRLTQGQCNICRRSPPTAPERNPRHQSNRHEPAGHPSCQGMANGRGASCRPISTKRIDRL
ncbi:hypothetical protein J3F83DRAFT_729490 [Trichoderma novae-zelandiae]